MLGDLGPVVNGPGAYGRGKWVDCSDTNLVPALGWSSDNGMGRPVL